MAQTITIDPVTRIEGHAKVTVYLDDAGQVTNAQLNVNEFRGFEKSCSASTARTSSTRWVESGFTLPGRCRVACGSR